MAGQPYARVGPSGGARHVAGPCRGSTRYAELGRVDKALEEVELLFADRSVRGLWLRATRRRRETAGDDEAHTVGRSEAVATSEVQMGLFEAGRVVRIRQLPLPYGRACHGGESCGVGAPIASWMSWHATPTWLRLVASVTSSVCRRLSDDATRPDRGRERRPFRT